MFRVKFIISDSFILISIPIISKNEFGECKCHSTSIQVNDRCISDATHEVSVAPLTEDFNHTHIPSDWIEHGGVSFLLASAGYYIIRFAMHLIYT